MEFLLIILSSVLFTAPYYFPNLFFLSFFAFIPLIYLIRENDYSHSFIIALLIGFLNSLFSLFWLYEPLSRNLKMPFSFNIAVLLFYFLISGLPLALWALINKFIQPKKSYSPAAAALVWSSLEYFRFEFLNFNPFNYFAYSQSSFSFLTQYAAYGGIFLVSFISVLIASYLVKFYLLLDWKKIVPLLIVIVFLIVFPYFNNSTNTEAYIKESADLIVNTKIKNENHFKAIEKNIDNLSLLTAEAKSKYIFTPEKSLDFDIEKNNYYRNYLKEKLKNTFENSYLQLGSLAAFERTYNSNKNNSLFLFSDELEIINRTNKNRNLLSAVNFAYLENIIDFSKSYFKLNEDLFKKAESNQPETRQIIEVEKLKYINLFSEEIFIPLSNQLKDYSQAVNLIVNSAVEENIDSKVYNNYSLAAAVYRASESRTDLIRVVSGGYSSYIDEKGKIIFKKRIVNDLETVNLNLEKNMSYYQQYPKKAAKIIYTAFLILLLIKIIISLRNKYSSKN